MYTSTGGSTAKRRSSCGGVKHEVTPLFGMVAGITRTFTDSGEGPPGMWTFSSGAINRAAFIFQRANVCLKAVALLPRADLYCGL